MPSPLAPRPRARAARLLALCGLLGLTTAAACDTPAPDPAAAPAATPATPTAPAEAAPAAPTYDACLAACNQAGSADDKATCRLNCKASEGLDRRKVGAAEAPARTSFHALHACRDACTNPDDLAGCANACLAQAARSEPALSLLPAGQAEAHKACAEACLGAVMNCSVECASAGQSADDRATCRLQCDAVGATCLGNCGA